MLNLLKRCYLGHKSLSQRLLVLTLVLSMPSAYAVVYKSVPVERSATEAIDSALDDSPVGKRKYILNGQNIEGKLSYSSHTPQELIVVLSHDWQDKSEKLNSSNANNEPALSIAKPLVSSGENWGMFANLNLLGTSDEANEVPTLAERYIVFALQPDQKSKSDVWVLNIPEGVSPLSLMVPASSGGDVPVYPGNKLNWSLVEATRLGESELHIYSGAGAVADYIEHYKNAYISQGFRYDDIVRPDSPQGDTQLLFSRSRSELNVTMQLSSEGVTSIIQLRKKK